jgi:hypothetical protein
VTAASLRFTLNGTQWWSTEGNTDIRPALSEGRRGNYPRENLVPLRRRPPFLPCHIVAKIKSSSSWQDSSTS